MKKKRSIIATSIVTIALSSSIAVGGTFALFTSESKVNIAVTSGKVDLVANISDLTLYSMGVEQTNGVFENGGTAVLDGNTLSLSSVSPGDKATFDVDITNNSNVPVQYKMEWTVDGALADALVILANEEALEDTQWTPLAVGEGVDSLSVSVELPEAVGNEYQKKSAEISFRVEAVQGNAHVSNSDEWDGTADITWYNDTDTEFELSTAEQFAGFASLVDNGNTFEGKTVKLKKDLDLRAYDEVATVDGEESEPQIIPFNPIGSYRKDKPFKGTFDGNGKTISNLSQNTWELDTGYYYGDLGLGLFGLVQGATIKNLTIDGADISGESAICGIVAGCAYGDCTFENITVSNSKGADYQYYSGGIVGWASGNHQYINCNVDASTTIAAQWGDFDNSTGGIIGGCGGNAQILLKDCTVACRIDAYNDVTSTYQWYAYRRCGMLIGNTGKTTTVDGTTYAAAPQLTCENVTVIYGEWANYTYCEFAGTSWPYVRVQAGVSNSAYSNPRYGHPTDANGNEVVDDNHVHNDGEDHQILCAFDQLYGGAQGVYGAAAHDGVTVVYPESYNNQ